MLTHFTCQHTQQDFKERLITKDYISQCILCPICGDVKRDALTTHFEEKKQKVLKEQINKQLNKNLPDAVKIIEEEKSRKFYNTVVSLLVPLFLFSAVICFVDFCMQLRYSEIWTEVKQIMYQVKHLSNNIQLKDAFENVKETIIRRIAINVWMFLVDLFFAVFIWDIGLDRKNKRADFLCYLILLLFIVLLVLGVFGISLSSEVNQNLDNLKEVYSATFLYFDPATKLKVQQQFKCCGRLHYKDMGDF